MTDRTSRQGTSAGKHILAYKKMLERVKDLLAQQNKRTGQGLEHSLEAAKQKAVELGELDEDEADAIGRYVKRDLREAGRHLAVTGGELRTWLGIDIQLMEDWLLDMFAQVADKTKLEWMQLEKNAQEASHYHTGEVTGPGTLQCTACGERVHFYTVGHVPPCPKCHETVFIRPAK
jgi:Zinc-ribbon containing domain